MELTLLFWPSKIQYSVRKEFYQTRQVRLNKQNCFVDSGLLSSNFFPSVMYQSPQCSKLKVPNS